MNINTDNIVISRTDNVVTLTRPEGRPIALVSGDVISADVLDIIESGLIMLRITPPAGKGEGTQGSVLMARTNVQLAEGDRISLEVLGGDKEVRLRLMGTEQFPSSTSTVDTIQQKIQSALSELSGARLTSSDVQNLKGLLNTIPGLVRSNNPEFKMLEAMMPAMERLNAQTLRTSVEGSGVLFETRIKLAALQELKNSPEVLMAKNALNSIMQTAVDGINDPRTDGQTRMLLNDLLIRTSEGIRGLNADNASETLLQLKQAVNNMAGSDNQLLTSIKQKLDDIISAHGLSKNEHAKASVNVNDDQKALLLKIKDLLQSDKMTEALKYSQANRDELTATVDKFIKNIEFFQLTSRANDMVCTFLPFSWNELRDGELLFKKNKYHAKKSFTCDINLDLDRLGKLSISVTVADGGFFLSFNAEKGSTKQLIMENKAELEKRFAESGLSLKIINIGQKSKLDFAEKTKSGGLDLRI
ncbi:MAG: flagellar hook-length control protein FliK [Nitrospirae bacterium]|nr:flagellar hook-length control protein FliK [Nitrospirota bacterium]